MVYLTSYLILFYLFFIHKKGGNKMLGLIALCFTIYFFAYLTIKAEGSTILVVPIRTFDDYFIDYNRKRLGDEEE